MLKVLEAVLPSILTLVPCHQTLEAVVGVLALALHVVAGSLQGEQNLIAGKHYTVTWPVGLAAKLVQHSAVFLTLDKVSVLACDQGAWGEVTRTLRGRVPDVELKTVLRLGGATGSVKLN